MAVTTTTYGYKMPATGDKGVDVFPALEHNITHGDGHSHNGTNGVKINPKDLDRKTTSILTGGWSAVAGQAGTYKQTVTVPTGYVTTTMLVRFIDTSTGHEIIPTVEKVTSTTYDVYINDNTIGLTAIYG